MNGVRTGTEGRISVPRQLARGVVHVVLPSDADDPAAPSGGNVYGRHLCAGLPEVGRAVTELLVDGDWPDADAAARDRLAAALASVADGGDVLVDGLVACGAPDVIVPECARLRVVVIVHLPLGDELGLDAETAASRRERERAVLHAATAVVVTSPWAASRVTGLHDLPSARVHVAAPGVDPAPLAPVRADGSSLLALGAHTPTKGHDVFVAALGSVADLSWWAQISGPERDPGHAIVVRELVEEHGLGDRVALTGAVVGDELDAVWEETDLLVLPSRTETYGMVVTEALARGIPVLATATGGVPETLGEAPGGGVPGLLVPPDDVGRAGGGVAALADRRRAARRGTAGGARASPPARRLGRHRAADGRGARVSASTWWRVLKPVVGVAIVVAVGARVGAGPVLDGLRALDVGTLVAAIALGAASVACNAWRWALITRRLGQPLSGRTAFGAYYRSTFLNSVLPAGVLGDVERAVGHGRRCGDVGGGVRSVVLDRLGGQVVLVGAGVAVLAFRPTLLDVSATTAWTAAAVLAVVLVLGWVLRSRLRALGADLRAVLHPGTGPAVLLASSGALAGYLATFVLAARAVGVTASLAELLPLLVLALLAMSLPLGVGGWGPREAALAAGFAAVGLPAAQGLATAVVYGTLALVACLPGGLVMLARRVTGTRRTTTPDSPPVPVPSPRDASDGRPTTPDSEYSCSPRLSRCGRCSASWSARA